MFRTIMLLVLCLSVSGCFVSAGVEHPHGWHHY